MEPKRGIGELLALVADGTPVDELASEFRAAVGMREPKTIEQRMRADYDNEFDLDEGWSDVEAAHMTGEITDEQYAAIREAVPGR